VAIFDFEQEGTMVRRTVRTAVVLLLLISSPISTCLASDGSNVTYETETYFGYVLYPELALDGNTSDENFTRIITYCPFYEWSDYCEFDYDNSYARAEYTFFLDPNVTLANLSMISKSGYLDVDEPPIVEMSIRVEHALGTSVVWSDTSTPGHMDNSENTWQLNESGPYQPRANGTLAVVIYIETDPIWTYEMAVEIRIRELWLDEVTLGCTDPLANNHQPSATDDDGSCDYDLDDDGVLDADEVPGCTNETANNFDGSATDDDGSCDYDLDDDGVLDADEVPGCTNESANNFDVAATEDDGSCDYDLDNDGVLDVNEVHGCADEAANNHQPSATDDDGSCDYDLDDDGVLDADEVLGCTNVTANNYQPSATEDDGSCDSGENDNRVLDADEVHNGNSNDTTPSNDNKNMLIAVAGIVISIIIFIIGNNKTNKHHQENANSRLHSSYEVKDKQAVEEAKKQQEVTRAKIRDDFEILAKKLLEQFNGVVAEHFDVLRAEIRNQFDKTRAELIEYIDENHTVPESFISGMSSEHIEVLKKKVDQYHATSEQHVLNNLNVITTAGSGMDDCAEEE
jgi:hypothetical protein